MVISTKEVQNIVDYLVSERHRTSTRQTYLRVWKLFNEFFVKLDDKPCSWEDRLTLFTGFLVNNCLKSSTVKSYILAIKGVLLEIGVKIGEDNYLLTALTKACKLKNDVVVNRLLICKGVVKLMLDQVGKLYMNRANQQLYLDKLFKAVHAAAYYGLLRIG